MAPAAKQVPFSFSSPGRRLLVAAGLAVATVLLVVVARRNIPPENVCPDFIQFWTAASLLTSRQDPYDAGLQAGVQQQLGWKREEAGLGIYDFLPYYYPPWLGLAFSPLLPLGYPLAKLAWLVVGGELVLASAVLLSPLIAGVSLPMVLLVTALFGFSIKAVAMGQVAPLVLLLVVLLWRLLESRRDLAAGAVLALLTIKPQLTLLLTGLLLLWSARQRRWRIWQGFAAAIVALCAVSTVAFPGWLPSMLAATRITPMPTHYYPGLGTTWLVALEAVGLHGFLLYLAYAAVVVPLLLALLRMTQKDDARLDELFSLALLAPFFVAPYARPYDFPILMIPALVLMATRLAEFPRLLLAFTLTALVGLHIVWQTVNYVAPVVGVRRPEFAYFWIPLLIGAVWLLRPRREAITGSVADLQEADRNGEKS